MDSLLDHEAEIIAANQLDSLTWKRPRGRFLMSCWTGSASPQTT